MTLLLVAFAPYSMGSFTPALKNPPPLPVIDWTANGAQIPVLSQDQSLRQCDRALIVWTNAEWAALDHVFCSSQTPMQYTSATSTSGWSTHWASYKGTEQLPQGAYYWFKYCYVDLTPDVTVCLVKAGIHLDIKSEGQVPFDQMLELVMKNVSPKLFVTTGTAGGASVFQTLGTSMAVTSASYQTDSSIVPDSNWPTYTSNWQPSPNLSQALALSTTVPVTADDLAATVTEFNSSYTYNFTLRQLDPDNLLMQVYPSPMCDYTYQTPIPLLTGTAFLTGTNDNLYGKYAFIEMDDAEIFRYVQANYPGVTLGAVRDISDPVQNVNLLPSEAQGNWGSAIYATYGFYTASNSAILSWACLVTGNISAPATQD